MKLATICLTLSAAHAATGPPTSVQTISKSPVQDAPKAVVTGKTTMTATTKRFTLPGGVVLAGGSVMHLILGTLFSWGNFAPYAPDSLKYFDGLSAAAHDGAPADNLSVMPLTICSMVVGMKLGALFISKIGVNPTAHMGTALLAAGVYLASFQTRLLPFILCYSCLVGLGIGMAYNAPMAAGWSHYPKRKGLVNGVVLTGFGFGGLVFNKIGSAIINPNGFSSPYPASVSGKFGHMLRSLSVIYLVVSQLACLFVRPAPKPEVVAGAQAPKAVGVSFADAAKSKTFWCLWLLVLMTGTPVLNIANIYKKFASEVPALNDDTFQANVGGLGALHNGFGRLFWSSMVDKYGFEKPFRVLVVLQSALLLALPLVTSSRAAFTAVTSLLFFCLGGIFVMFPTVNAQKFGPANAPEIYSLLYTGFATSSVLGFKLIQAMLKKLGWQLVFQLMAGMTISSLLIVQAL